MWEALDDICQREGKNLNQICGEVAQEKREGGFTSALRVFILNYYREYKAAEAEYREKAASEERAASDGSGT